TINCSLKSDNTYNVQKLNEDLTPITIYNFEPNQAEKAEQAFVGWFRNPSSSAWSESDIFKVNYEPLISSQYYLKVSIISFALGTQLEYEVDILNSARSIINQRKTFEPIAGTGTYKTDFHAYIQFE